MVQIRLSINIDGKAEYSWRQAHALYLVGSAGCSVLWAAPTQRNHLWGKHPTTIDAIKPSIAAETARLDDKTRQSDFQAP
ncbi:hypothetical protein AVEN_96486-1 [Araneus ventricosus]|uniref:Uncharacterized protein n=1 Tax=Araneus ventricosus TaxID=182803 RepID=A0A4Y2CVK6_ARAVE|nr:hypothetical protein AVEN_96486-1 [Araneus ventricosus]